MEYYLATKNKDILRFACKLMELESIILSEVTPTQNDMHVMYSIISGHYPKAKDRKKIQSIQVTVYRNQKCQQAEVPN